MIKPALIATKGRVTSTKLTGNTTGIDCPRSHKFSSEMARCVSPYLVAVFLIGAFVNYFVAMDFGVFVADDELEDRHRRGREKTIYCITQISKLLLCLELC